MKYDGKTKITKNLTFTLHYADGTSAEIERGILFSVDDEDKMDIHVGVSELWALFGVDLCLQEFIHDHGLDEEFLEYMIQMDLLKMER